MAQSKIFSWISTSSFKLMAAMPNFLNWSAERISDYILDTNNTKLSFFISNWDDTTYFPVLYGVGIIFAAKDPSQRMVVYISNGPELYIGKWTIDYTNRTVSTSWKRVNATAI